MVKSGNVINNKFVLEEKISENLFYDTYYSKEYNPAPTSQKYIVKVLNNDFISDRIEDRIRFKSEVESVIKYSNQYLVNTFGLEEENDTIYIINEYHDFFTLNDYMKSTNTPEHINEIINIIINIAKGLHYLNQKNIIHRNLTPNSIIMKWNNTGFYETKITDIGLSHIKEYGKVTNPYIEDIFGYMSPEMSGIIKRDIDSRSDLYSLGIIFYRLVSGVIPYSGSDISTIIHNHIAKEPVKLIELNPNVPKTIEKIIEKLIEKEPGKRYQSAEGLYSDLEYYLKGNEYFSPGENDILSNLNFSTELIGREEELATLKNLASNASEGKSSLCFISGESGRGKSRLCEELKSAIFETGGLFLSGKSFQGENKTPYGPFREILNNYIIFYRNSSKLKQDDIKTSLLNCLGNLGDLIIKLNPGMEEILGKCTKAAKLEPDLENKRFLYTAARLFLYLSKLHNYLLLAIEDIHWLDEGSFTLLHEIISNFHEGKMVIVATFRDNEILENRSYKSFLNKINEKKIPNERIILRALDADKMGEFVGELLHISPSSITSLTSFVFFKSKGNPLFAKEIVKKLIHDKIIYKDHFHWIIDYDLLTHANIPDTVIDTLLGRISLLERNESELISFCAAIGNSFEMEILFSLIRLPKESIVKMIDKAVVLQFLEIDEYERKIEFVHDRIREAFYRSLNKTKAKEIHLNIVQALEELYKNTIDSYIYPLAFHSIQSENNERILRYGFPAGLKAKSSYANEEALKYFYVIKDTLEKEGKQGGYEWIKCLNETGEIYLTIGKSDEAIELFDRTIEYTKDTMSRARIYRYICTAYFKKGDWINCEKYGKKGLNVLGEKLVSGKKTVKFGILFEFIQHIFYSHFPRKFLRKERKDVDKFKLIVSIYNYLNWMYILSDTPKFVKSVIRMLNISISKIGKSKELGLSFGMYGSLLASIPFFGLSDKYLRKSLSIRETVHDDWGIGQTSQWFGYKYLWEGSFEKSKEYFTKSLEKFKMIGDIRELGMTYSGLCQVELQLGNIIEARESNDYFNSFGARARDYYAYTLSLKSRSILLFLHGNVDDAIKVGFEAIELSKKHNITFLHCISLISLGVIYCETGNYIESIKYLEEAKIIDQNNNFINFYTSVLYIWLTESYIGYYIFAKEKSPAAFRKIRLFYKTAFKKNKKWIPNSFSLKRLEAKIAYFEGDLKKCEKLFHEGINLSNNLNNSYETARTQYEFSVILKKENREQELKQYLESAYRVFLEKNIHFYLSKASNLLGLRDSHTTIEKMIDKQKLYSIIRVSQNISTILNLNELLTEIISTAVQVTGAERGVLLIKEEDKLKITAQKNLYFKEFSNSEYQDSLDFSMGIVHKTFNLAEDVMITNAYLDPDFSNDIAVIRNKIKSMLAIPIHYKSVIKGVLYLDNTLADSVFMSEDTDLLKIFMSQSIIAIENARMYNQLQESQEQLMRNEKLASIGALAGSITHEIKNPLGAIMTNIQSLKMDLEDLGDIKEKESILSGMRDSIDVIELASRQSKNIIMNMLDFSRIENGERCTIDFARVINTTNLLIKKELLNNKIDFIIDASDNLYINGNSGELTQVMLNFLINSKDAILEKNGLERFIKLSAYLKNEKVIIEIEDNGIGIKNENREKIFNAFFTTKEAGKGTGLGMSVAYSILQKHSAKLDFESTYGEGTKFIISFDRITEF